MSKYKKATTIPTFEEFLKSIYGIGRKEYSSLNVWAQKAVQIDFEERYYTKSICNSRSITKINKKKKGTNYGLRRKP